MTHFNLAAINFAWLPILPMLTVVIGATVVLLAGVRTEDEESEGLGWLTLAVLALALVFTLGLIGEHGIAFSGSLAIDNYSAFFEILILITAAFTVLSSLDYAGEFALPGAEYYSLLLFATFGMMLMAAGDDLIVIFLGLEVMSLAVYVLVGLARRNLKSNEAALKYFLLGAFSTAFMLYGIALLYGATGSVKLEAIRAALTGPAVHSPMLLAGVGLILIGFGFKVAAVPFHMWAPDAYEGAPAPITGFMAAGVKLAAFAGFLRIFMVHLGTVGPTWTAVLWVVAAVTMTTGNLIALVQSNIKRMLAYSAVAHAGYILVAMVAAGTAAGSAILYYLLGYALANLGAFSVVAALERRGRERDSIAAYRGLAMRRPALAGAMAIFLLSLTGIPPLAGFVGKFYIFSAALGAGLLWLVIIAVLNSVVSAYYYIGVLVAMYMQEGEAEVERASGRPAVAVAIILAAAGTILIGVYPQPYMSAAASAFTSALGTTLPAHAVSTLVHWPLHVMAHPG